MFYFLEVKKETFNYSAVFINCKHRWCSSF